MHTTLLCTCLCLSLSLSLLVVPTESRPPNDFSFSLPGRWGSTAKRFKFSLPGKWGSEGKRMAAEDNYNKRQWANDYYDLSNSFLPNTKQGLQGEN